MMNEVFRIDPRGANAVDGRVVWSPRKSIWNMTMIGTSVILGPAMATPGAIAMFLVFSYASLLLGHSVGMHRYLIHRTYRCHRWLANILIYIGTIVGVAGPFGVLRIHDARDWAQRQRGCHDFFAHRRAALVDLFWQLNCEFRYQHPPRIMIEPEVANDPWYRFLERTWMLQQVPIGLLLFGIGDGRG